MKINEVIEVIKGYLSLKGMPVETDPYSDFKSLKSTAGSTVILIEEKEVNYERSVTGLPVRANSIITLTLIKRFERTGSSYIAQKKVLEETTNDIIKFLCGDGNNEGIDDCRFSISPLNSSHNEISIDSTLCLARIIELEIITGFN